MERALPEGILAARGFDLADTSFLCPESFTSTAEKIGPDVGRPVADQGLEAGAVDGVEGAGGFFVVGEVAGDGGEEAADGFTGLARGLRVGVAVAGVVDQAAEGGGGSVGLLLKPLPVAGKQGDLAGGDSEAGTAGAGARRGRQGARESLLQRAAQIEVNLASAPVFKDEKRRSGVSVEVLLEDGKQGWEGSGGEQGDSEEG